jgi:hypothetical protein
MTRRISIPNLSAAEKLSTSTMHRINMLAAHDSLHEPIYIKHKYVLTAIFRPNPTNRLFRGRFSFGQISIISDNSAIF